MSDLKLRPSQEEVVSYTGGKMAVAAVPGSGKTFTLSYLAAELVTRLSAENRLDEQEVLIVTFTNPAVNSFRHRISNLVQQERGLLPYVGYRVRTLHGLAHDIVRMRPGLVGLSESFEILDERVTSTIIRDMAERWIRTDGDMLLDYFDFTRFEDIESASRTLRRKGVDLVESLAYEVIRLGKDNLWEPDEMAEVLNRTDFDLPLARMGIDLYAGYQRGLGYRGAVDFDDLVRYAMAALESDPEFLARLRVRWPYILEDEAQDSSKLQNDMLRLLSGDGNWVRVGDPNQSIYTTFTTADSNLLRRFIDEDDVANHPLPVSGRSAPPVITLANHLVEWTGESSLLPDRLRRAFYAQKIEPTAPGDPQPNPVESFIYLDWDPEKNVTPESEIDRVLRSLERWLPDHKDWTVAVLVPENSRGFKIAEALKERDIEYEELLRSTSSTRDAASRLQVVFDFLADPTDGRRLGTLFRDVWWMLAVPDPEHDDAIRVGDQVYRALNKLRTTEDFLWPGPEGDWIDSLGDDLDESVRALLEQFRAQAQFWLNASSLPVDQLTLTISQALFTGQADIALGHKIAVVLGSIAVNNPEYRLPHLAQELRSISQNERRFLGFDDAAEGYEPKKGVVTVATMHAAKGLEWDRVYLMAVNNYSFPAAQPADSYIAEKWFIRDDLNLQAEVHEQVELLMAGKAGEYVEGRASREARIDYAAERLRLLYVGITRAKRDLVITWNMGRFWEQGRENSAAAALIELTGFWERELKS
ncbi:MAG: ATP-dependent helicase [Anaerolineae bacterium]|nr:ATP-dependent helicase [Anaerolineae bacterium]